MQDNSIDEKDVAVKDSTGKVKFYEIGYVLLPSIAKEKIAEHVAAITDIVAKAAGKIIAHGDPELTPLAYVMTKKIHGTNHRFDDGYFGWVKFELPAGVITSVKKSLDANENILRYLLMTTVKENTYLGKRASVYVLGVAGREAGIIAPEAPSAESPADQPPVSISEVTENVIVSVPSSAVPQVAAASVEEMDKSIDAMVKEM